MDAKDRRIAELEAKVAALEAENAALKVGDAPRMPAYMEAVKKTVKDFPFMGWTWTVVARNLSTVRRPLFSYS